MRNSLARGMAIRTADTILKRHPRLMERWNYEVGVILKAIELVWKKTGDQKYYDYIQSNLDYFIEDDGNIKTYTVNEYNLDQVNTGKALLTIYQETKNEKYKKALDLLRKQLLSHPRTSGGGFWHKQIYPSQMWLDGIYMASPFYAEYAATFNEPEAFDDVIRQFSLLYQHAKDPVTGLLYHAWNENKEQKWANPQTGCSPHVWGRALGWYAMALVDVLDFIPVSEGRELLLQILNEVMKAIVKVQDSTTGVWYQVLDLGNREGNYIESSASAMFVYALAKGLNRGYLGQEYQSSRTTGYEGLLRNFVKVNGDGLVDYNGICSVAGLGKYKEDMEYRDGTFAYYISEPIVANDYKGVGPFIMASVEMGGGL